MKRELRTQIRKLEKLKETATAEAKESRDQLKLVRADLASARVHFRRAAKIDKAMNAVDREINRLLGKKTKKKTAKKKTTTKKATKKVAKKKTATRKKRVTKKK